MIAEQSHLSAAISLGDDQGSIAWLAGESQANDDSDLNGIDDSLLCNEIFDSSLNGFGLNAAPQTSFGRNANDVSLENNPSYGIADLENLELDTPPDFSDVITVTIYVQSLCSTEQSNFSYLPAGFAVQFARQHLWLARSSLRRRHSMEQKAL